MNVLAEKIRKSAEFNTRHLNSAAPNHCSKSAMAWAACAGRLLSAIVGAWVLLGVFAAEGGAIFVPNYSFESPAAPTVPPYAMPDIDDWEKSAQPAWYNPTNNNNTPWAYLMGTFYNSTNNYNPTNNSYIDNCDGSQAAFVFAVPDVALFQDHDSVYGTNTTPSHAFNAKFNVGSSYDLKVALIGGGGSMLQGVTFELDLYYRDAASNMVTVGSTTVTNTLQNFPTNTHFVDFSLRVPAVKASDAWAGQNIGIQLLSTADFTNAGGYWDVDNVRLNETPAPALTLTLPGVTNGQFSFTIDSQPGVSFELQATTNLLVGSSNWTSLGSFTNISGALPFTDSSALNGKRYYRARQL